MLVSREIGSRDLINALIERVLDDSHFIERLDAQTVCQNLVSLNLAGIDSKRPEFNAYVSALSNNLILKQLTDEECTVLDEICRKEIQRLGLDQTGKIATL